MSIIDTYRIPILQDDNWRTWSYRMKIVLGCGRVKDHIEPDAKPPTPVDLNNPTPEEKAKIEEWEHHDNEARFRIIEGINDTNLHRVLDTETARELWAGLEAYHEPYLAHRRQILTKEHSTLRDNMRRTQESIVPNIKTIKKMRDDMFRAGLLKIGDQDVAHVLGMDVVKLLPRQEPWDSMATSWTAREIGGETLDLDEIIRVIEMVLQMRNPPVCANCGKANHVNRECWAEGGGREGEGPKRRDGSGAKGR